MGKIIERGRMQGREREKERDRGRGSEGMCTDKGKRMLELKTRIEVEKGSKERTKEKGCSD